MTDFGILSSLGIGSGVLNYDVIDKLKETDQNIMIKPIEDKLDFVNKQETALKEFNDIFSNIKDKVYDFANDLITSKIKTNISGSSANVSVEPGTKPQTFSINVKQLAQNDIYESNSFSSPDEIITNKDTTLKLGIGDTLTNITIKSGATLEDLKNLINEANLGITATILNTDVNDSSYKLLLKANDTGENNTIKFDYGTITDLGFNQTVYQSAAYSSDTDLVNNNGSTQTFKITINGTEYSMNVADGTTVSDFIDAINNEELKDNNGNILQGVSAKYNSDTGRIEIHLQQIGDISIDDTNLTTNINSNTNFVNSQRIQEAKNAMFDYNGVEIQREKNEVKDIIPGVTINLKTIGESNISLKYDVENTINELSKFVADYNKMIDNLQQLTSFDQEKNTVGLFNNDIDFKSIENNLYKSIFSSLDFDRVGLSYDKNGHISFDSEKFLNNFNNNPEEINSSIRKVFKNLNSTMDNIQNNLEFKKDNLTQEEQRLKKQEDSLNKLLEERYNIMAKKFEEYDKMINNFNNQATVIQNLILQSLQNK